MSSYLKPQSPLYHKEEDTYFYPLTTVDQVIMPNGSRLSDKVLKPKAGFIYPLATSVVPEGFLLCDGAAYSRTEYPELFDAIGTIYGAGDGSTTFNVPNLAQRVPVGKGTGYELGATGGAKEISLEYNNLPNGTIIFTSGKTGDWSVGKWNDHGQTDSWIARPLSQQSEYFNTAVDNMQPYTVVNYIIATGKNTSVQDIVAGVQALPLGVEYGGTGATDIQNARSNLGLGSVSTENIVPIEKGGTGATSATQARESLGAAPAKIYRCGTATGDLNEVTTPGWYWVKTENCTNTPYGDNFSGIFAYLEVVTSSLSDQNVLQRFTLYNNGKTWVRSSVNGWKSWVRVDSTGTHPVGSIYLSAVNTSPASLFGGTWEQLKDRFLLGAGSTYTAGNTGGAATHKLTVNEMPSHNHSFNRAGRDSGSDWIGGEGTATIVSETTGSAGGGAAHNNMPPYLVVYMWKRVS